MALANNNWARLAKGTVTYTPTEQTAAEFKQSATFQRMVERGASTAVVVDPAKYAELEAKRGGGRMSSLSKALKKATSVATNVATGFAGGGNVGAVAGLTRGVYENTKTSKAETINLRTAGQGFATGAVANIAAGAAAKLPAVFTALGSGGAPGSSALTKAAQFGKSGGFTGNIGNILKAGGNLVSKAGPVLAGFFRPNAGVVPGESGTPAEALNEQAGLANRVKQGFRTLKPYSSTVKDIAGQIRENGVDEVIKDKYRDYKGGGLPAIMGAGPTPANAPIVLEAGMAGGSTTQMILVAALLGGLYFATRKA